MNLEVLQHDYNKALEYQSKAVDRLADAKALYEVKQTEAEQSNTTETKQEAEATKQSLQDAQVKVEAANKIVEAIKKRIEVTQDLAENQSLARLEGRAVYDSGMKIISEPNQLRHQQVGNYAHTHSDKFIAESELPQGLKEEKAVTAYRGFIEKIDEKTAQILEINLKREELKLRMDRVDTKNCVVYDIKSNLDKNTEKNNAQLQLYVDYMNYTDKDGKTWTGKIVTYDFKEVEAYMIDKGLLSEKSQELDISQKKQEELKYQDQVIDQTKDYGYGY